MLDGLGNNCAKQFAQSLLKREEPLKVIGAVSVVINNKTGHEGH